jgi:uncharacterized protein YbjT (DUF2867 family)
MGQAVIRHLLRDTAQDWRIRVFTRDDASVHARRVLSWGAPGNRVELFRGQLDDEASIRRALDGAYGAFANTDFWSSGSVLTERRQGLAVLRAARDAGLEHFVWSSLDAAGHLSRGRVPVAHFDAKAAVEHEIDVQRADEFMRQETGGWYSRHASVLVTLAYFENFTSYFLPPAATLSDGRQGHRFSLPLHDARFPMVALDDVGHFTAMMFADRERWGGVTLPIGSDAPTMAELAATFERVTGIPAEYQPMTDGDWLGLGLPAGHDILNQFRFHAAFGPMRDFDALRALHPGLLSFEQWLRQSGWRGEAREVQKPPA